MRLRFLELVFPALLLGGLVLPGTAYSQTPTGVFASYELKKDDLSAFPQWQRVLEAIKRERDLYQRCKKDIATCPDPALGKWQTFIRHLEENNLNEHELLEQVQRFSRRWPYREDMTVYQQSDYWASPQEFAGSGGDCEDFAILNYVTLIDMGISAKRLRIVVVRDNIRQMDHAVLAVYPRTENGEIQILDSLMNGVLKEPAFSHYTPVYSVSEKARWIHIPQKDLYENNNLSYK